MAYGVKRGIKTPGEFGISDIFGLGLAGSAGIIAALVTDYQQQGEASALFTINQWVVAASSILGLSAIPLWMVAVGLIVVGAVSIFYFQPITRQGAFAQGFGLLAVLMTAVPGDLAGGLEAIGDEFLPGLEELPTVEEAGFTREAVFAGGAIINASYSPAEVSSQTARLIQVQNRQTSRYEVVITINFPEGIPSNVDTMIRRGEIRGRLHNEETNETWNLFRTSGGTVKRSGNKLTVSAGVPTRSDSSRLWIRVEAMGYAIEEQSAMATRGERLKWTVDMTPSNMPLFVQRLNKSYWF